MSSERENAIRESFKDQDVYFNYPADLDKFNYLIGNFTQEKSDYVDNNDNEIGENLRVNELIVMDDVSGLADKSADFSNFLTVSRKYGFSCVYVFHAIYPGRQSWEMIMSQKHIFNFFSGSVHSSRILKTLALFTSRQKTTYLPNQQVWLTKLYFKISNSKEKKCLTIDTREVNELGPGKFRTSADNGEVQTCYFNRNKSDTYFDSFQSKRIVSLGQIKFFIVKANFNCFELVNKSLDFSLKTSNSNSIDNEQLKESSTRESFNNGKFSISTRRTEPRNTFVQRRRNRELSAGKSRRDTTSRKKPRFISAV